jgi:methyl-accepting chemotaxis protein
MPKPAIRLVGLLSGFFVSIYFPICAYAQTQTTFSGLPYSTTFLQEKLVEHSRSYTARTAFAAIPANLSMLMAFRAILTDVSLQKSLDARDVEVIGSLPAPVDQRFILPDHDELNAICARVSTADEALEIQELARRFDEAKARKEEALDAHYAAALDSLSPSTQEQVERLRSELSATRNLTYTVFDLAGFAQELPDAAQAILSHGCVSFTQRLATYTPEVVTLRDQVPRS